MCFKISVFAANMNLFPHVDKDILKKKLRKPSQSYNSNKILAHITACNNWVREGAGFTLSQLLICLWRISYFDNLMLLLQQLQQTHFKKNGELALHFKNYEGIYSCREFHFSSISHKYETNTLFINPPVYVAL